MAFTKTFQLSLPRTLSTANKIAIMQNQINNLLDNERIKRATAPSIPDPFTTRVPNTHSIRKILINTTQKIIKINFTMLLHPSSQNVRGREEKLSSSNQYKGKLLFAYQTPPTNTHTHIFIIMM